MSWRSAYIPIELIQGMVDGMEVDHFLKKGPTIVPDAGGRKVSNRCYSSIEILEIS